MCDQHLSNIITTFRKGKLHCKLIDTDAAMNPKGRKHIWSFTYCLHPGSPFSENTVKTIREWDLEDIELSLRYRFMEMPYHTPEQLKEGFDMMMRRLRFIKKCFDDFSGWTPSSFMLLFNRFEEVSIHHNYWMKRGMHPIAEEIPKIPSLDKLRTLDTLPYILSYYARTHDEDSGDPKKSGFYYLVRKLILEEPLVERYKASLGDVDLKSWADALAASGEYFHYHDPATPFATADLFKAMGINHEKRKSR